MRYLEESVFFRVMAGSWTLGWLFQPPGEARPYLKESRTYKISSKALGFLLAKLAKPGQGLLKLGKGSIFIENTPGFIGLLLFFYLSFDMAWHHYSPGRVFTQLALALLALSMPLWKHFPGVWRGSLFYRVVKWWVNTD